MSSIEQLVENIVKYKWGSDFTVADVLRTEQVVIEMLNGLNTDKDFVEDEEQLATVTPITSIYRPQVGDTVCINTNRPEASYWNGFKAKVNNTTGPNRSKIWLVPIGPRPDDGTYGGFYWPADELKKTTLHTDTEW